MTNVLTKWSSPGVDHHITSILIIAPLAKTPRANPLQSSSRPINLQFTTMSPACLPSRTLHHPWPQPALFDPPSVSVFLGPDLYRIGLLISSSPTEPYPSLHHASGMICRLNSASFIFPLPRPGERGSRVCCSGARFHRRGPGYTKFLKIYSDLTKNVSILSILG